MGSVLSRCVCFPCVCSFPHPPWLERELDGFCARSGGAVAHLPPDMTTSLFFRMKDRVWVERPYPQPLTEKLLFGQVLATVLLPDLARLVWSYLNEFWQVPNIDPDTQLVLRYCESAPVPKTEAETETETETETELEAWVAPGFRRVRAIHAAGEFRISPYQYSG